MAAPTFSTFNPIAYRLSSSSDIVYGYIIPNYTSDITTLYKGGTAVRVTDANSYNIRITSSSDQNLYFVLIIPDEGESFNKAEIEDGNADDVIGSYYVIKSDSYYRTYYFKANEINVVNFKDLFDNAEYYFGYTGDVTNAVIQIMSQIDTVVQPVKTLSFQFTTSNWISTTEEALNLSGIDVTTGCNKINKKSTQTIAAGDLSQDLKLKLYNKSDYESSQQVKYSDLVPINNSSIATAQKTVVLSILPTFLQVANETFGSESSTDPISKNKFYINDVEESPEISWLTYNPTYFDKDDSVSISIRYYSKFYAQYDASGKIFVKKPKLKITFIEIPVKGQPIKKLNIESRILEGIHAFNKPENIETQQCSRISTFSTAIPEHSILIEYIDEVEEIKVKTLTFTVDNTTEGFSVGSGRKVYFEQNPIQVSNNKVTVTESLVDNANAMLKHYKDQNGRFIDFAQKFTKSGFDLDGNEIQMSNMWHTLNDVELDYLFNKRPNHAKLIKCVDYGLYNENLYANCYEFSQKLLITSTVSTTVGGIAAWYFISWLSNYLWILKYFSYTQKPAAVAAEEIFTSWEGVGAGAASNAFLVLGIVIICAIIIGVTIAAQKGRYDYTCGIMLLPDNWENIANNYISELQKASESDIPDKDLYIQTLQASLKEDDTHFEATFIPLYTTMGAHFVIPGGYQETGDGSFWKLKSCYWGSSSEYDGSNQTTVAKGTIYNTNRRYEYTFNTWSLPLRGYPQYMAYYAPNGSGKEILWKISKSESWRSTTVYGQVYNQVPIAYTDEISTSTEQIYYDNLCTGSDSTYYSGRINVGFEYKKICNGMFNGSNILYCKVPTGVTTIGRKAFYGSKLRSIVIPLTVTSIEADAFTGTNLTQIYYEANQTAWNIVSKSSAGIPSNCSIIYNKYDSV